MTLLILLVLTLLPLFGVAYIVFYGSPTTVDGLFISLILLAIAGIVGMNALYELRKGKGGAASKGSSATRSATRTSSGGVVRRGKVQEVVFFESNVGQPNKSIVTLSDGSAASSQMLVLEGDARNALPVGRSVEITLRKDGGQNVNVLVNVSYC
jgi:hypothetical protein